MTNFGHFKSEPQFDIFTDVAVSAEKIIHIDPEAAVINCRRAVEFAVKYALQATGKSIFVFFKTTSGLKSCRVSVNQ